ncbi:MAG: HIRAN domain-containing protein [Ignavibacteriales bacterium]|nr:HIRAN domain-containing protein [Ignavibacteriales bacterium]
MKRGIFLKRMGVGILALFIPKTTHTKEEKKKYFLTKFYVAGFIYYDGETVINKLKIGDELKIIQEPQNFYDRRALEIFTNHNVKLGYVPMEQNPIPSRLMRQELKIVGLVDKINLRADPWKMLRISLFAEV